MKLIPGVRQRSIVDERAVRCWVLGQQLIKHWRAGELEDADALAIRISMYAPGVAS